MRGRSSTVSCTRARSVSFSARLALTTRQHPFSPSLESLPTEILFEIIHLAVAVSQYSTSTVTAHRLGSAFIDDDNDSSSSDIFKHRPRLDYRTLRTLALTSRILAGLAHSILYSSVSLDDSKHMNLFARTVIDCAHRDITITSTTSPVSPTLPTSVAFSTIPTLYAGKFTTRLALEYPFYDSLRPSKVRHTDIERFHAATGALLGVGQSAPSVASPVLASLRTLVIDSRILEQHLRQQTPFVGGLSPVVSPTPSEVILHTYIPWHLTPSPLAPLAMNMTHLTIACPPTRWTLPSTTLAALGGAPALSHLALVRRANANVDNDDEFARDVADILSQRTGLLVRLVLVVLPDAGYTAWTYNYEHEDVNSTSSEDLPLSTEIRTLQAYLASTYIWSQFDRLACSSPSVCVVPGIGDPWTRALQKSRKSGAIFQSNIFNDEGSGRDLWSWAHAYGSEWRRRRHAIQSTICI